MSNREQRFKPSRHQENISWENLADKVRSIHRVKSKRDVHRGSIHKRRKRDTGWQKRIKEKRRGAELDRVRGREKMRKRVREEMRTIAGGKE